MPQRGSQWKACIFNDILRRKVFTRCYAYRIR